MPVLNDDEKDLNALEKKVADMLTEDSFLQSHIKYRRADGDLISSFNIIEIDQAPQASDLVHRDTDLATGSDSTKSLVAGLPVSASVGIAAVVIAAVVLIAVSVFISRKRSATEQSSSTSQNIQVTKVVETDDVSTSRTKAGIKSEQGRASAVHGDHVSHNAASTSERRRMPPASNKSIKLSSVSSAMHSTPKHVSNSIQDSSAAEKSHIGHSLSEFTRIFGLFAFSKTNEEPKEEPRENEVETSVQESAVVSAKEPFSVKPQESESSKTQEPSPTQIIHSKGDIGQIKEVIKSWIPQRDDELRLSPGDRVIVLQVFDDGWCDGKKLGSDFSGAFPRVCLKWES